LRRRARRLHLQVQCGAGRQGLRELRGDDDVADLERRQPLGRLADDQRLEHLPRLEQRSRDRRGGRDDARKLRLD
jgi:hypothetical protein